MPLKPSELADAMQEAFKTEWQAAKQSAMPEAGLADRRLLFAAVARGLLEYIEAQQRDVISSITVDQGGGQTIRYTVTDTDLNILTE